jgi:RP/EB family microtubule-associated protein
VGAAADDESPARSAAASRPAGSAASSSAAAPKAAASSAARPAARVGAAKPAAKKSAGGGDDAAELTSQLSKLTITIEGLEKERNFYFGKLREIEILAQDADAADEAAVAAAAAESADLQAFKKQVLAVLYATDDNAEFQAPEEAAAAPAGDEGLLGNDELPVE